MQRPLLLLLLLAAASALLSPTRAQDPQQQEQQQDEPPSKAGERLSVGYAYRVDFANAREGTQVTLEVSTLLLRRAHDRPAGAAALLRVRRGGVGLGARGGRLWGRGSIEREGWRPGRGWTVLIDGLVG